MHPDPSPRRPPPGVAVVAAGGSRRTQYRQAVGFGLVLVAGCAVVWPASWTVLVRSSLGGEPPAAGPTREEHLVAATFDLTVAVAVLVLMGLAALALDVPRPATVALGLLAGGCLVLALVEERAAGRAGPGHGGDAMTGVHGALAVPTSWPLLATVVALAFVLALRGRWCPAPR